MIFWSWLLVSTICVDSLPFLSLRPASNNTPSKPIPSPSSNKIPGSIRQVASTKFSNSTTTSTATSKTTSTTATTTTTTPKTTAMDDQLLREDAQFFGRIRHISAYKPKAAVSASGNPIILGHYNVSGTLAIIHYTGGKDQKLVERFFSEVTEIYVNVHFYYTELRHIRFPKLRKFGSPNKAVEFVLLRNHKLENVTFPSEMERHWRTLVIRDCPLLPEKTISAIDPNYRITQFMQNENHELHRPGDCVPSTKGVKRLSYLERCRTLVGDLIIINKTILDQVTNTSIEKITGCLNIVNSKIVDLSIFQNADVGVCQKKGMYKSYVRIPRTPHTEDVLDGLGIINETPCVSITEKFNASQRSCSRVEGDVIVTRGQDRRFLALFPRIKYITGILKIERTSFSTLNFANLEHLDGALIITDNEYLEKISFPRLSTVSHVVVRNNRKLPSQFLDRLSRFDANRSPSITTAKPATTPPCDTPTSYLISFVFLGVLLFFVLLRAICFTSHSIQKWTTAPSSEMLRLKNNADFTPATPTP